MSKSDKQRKAQVDELLKKASEKLKQALAEHLGTDLAILIVVANDKGETALGTTFSPEELRPLLWEMLSRT